ncbi:MAG: hypothetical protein WBN09_09615 [Woeseiaceae bacterium]
MEDNQTPEYYAVGPMKFVAMSTCTFGLYDVYWSYKNWKFVKARDGSDLWPWARALFYGIWHYSLLTRLNESLNSATLKSGLIRGLLAAMLLIVNALWKLPDPYWLLCFLTPLAFLPALKAVPAAQDGNPVQEHISSFHPSNLVAYLLGGPMFVLVALSAIGYFPGTAVTTGDDLWDRDKAYLIEANLLGPDEEIIYFYSLGVFSIAEDGQFISDEYVTTYVQDPEDGETYMDFAAYENIQDIEVQWSESFFEDTVVTVIDRDGFEFDLWLSAENGGDRKFVDALNARWRAATKAE